MSVGIMAACNESLADWILVGKAFAGQAGIDDANLGRCRGVLRAKGSPGKNGNSQHREKVIANDVEVFGVVLVFVPRVAFYREIRSADVICEVGDPGGRNRLYAWAGGDGRVDTRVLGDVFSCRVLALRQIDFGQ